MDPRSRQIAKDFLEMHVMRIRLEALLPDVLTCVSCLLIRFNRGGFAWVRRRGGSELPTRFSHVGRSEPASLLPVVSLFLSVLYSSTKEIPPHRCRTPPN